MTHTQLSLAQLRERIVEWGAATPGVRAVLEVGAGARRDNPADAWSDLDIELYFDDSEPFLTRSDWFEAFAPVWVYLPLPNEGSFPSRLVIYEGGNKVDFTLMPLEQLERQTAWREMPPMYRRGYLVHVDKDGVAARMPPSPFAKEPFTPPTTAEFRFAVEEFWFEAFHIAKYLRRDDLWSAKFRDWTTKECLMKLLEWHAHVANSDADTWHSGRFLGQWADAATWAELHEAFGHFGAADSWRALLATVAIAQRIGPETARGFGYPYPQDVDRNISGYIHELHGGA